MIVSGTKKTELGSQNYLFPSSNSLEGKKEATDIFTI